MNTYYRSPWARQYNPLKRRQGESYKRHEDRVARYCVIVIALIALGLITWTTKAVPDKSVNTSAGNSHYHGTHNEEALHD